VSKVNYALNNALSVWVYVPRLQSALTALKSLHSNGVNSVTRLAVDDAVHHLAENVKGMNRTPHELTALCFLKHLRIPL